jgi:hypothetical protein
VEIHYVVSFEKRGLLAGARSRAGPLVVLDKSGRVMLKARKAEVYDGGDGRAVETLMKRIEESLVAPEVYVITGSRFIDLSFMTSPKQLAETIASLLEDSTGRAIVVVKRE